jgi:hypothetical protein
MTSKTARYGCKAAVREVFDQVRTALEAERPISAEDLASLFNHLDAALSDGCDHTFRFTRMFLVSRSLSTESVLSWLPKFGGYCDCEVLANVEESWPDGKAV